MEQPAVTASNYRHDNKNRTSLHHDDGGSAELHRKRNGG